MAVRSHAARMASLVTTLVLWVAPYLNDVHSLDGA